MIYTVGEASTAIQNLLYARGTTLFSPLGRPEILLKEVDPAKPLGQFGGFVKIRRFNNGEIQWLGAAGRGFLTGMSLGYGRLNTTIEMTKYTVDAYNAVQDAYGGAYAFVHQAQGLTMIASTDYNEADVAEELFLGWICGAVTATIYAGPAAIGHGNSQTLMRTCDLSMAGFVWSRVGIDWSKIDVSTYKTSYLNAIDTEIRHYFEESWDTHMTGLEAEEHDVPITFFTLPGSIEVGLTLNQETFAGFRSQIMSATFGFPHVYINADQTLAALEAEGGVPATVGYLAHFPIGREIGGLFLPRLSNGTPAGPVTSETTSTQYIATRLIDPTLNNAVTNWPTTIDGQSAKGVLSAALPGIYVKGSGYATSGEITLSEIIGPLNFPTLGFGRMSASAPVDGNDPGDRNLEMPIGGNSYISNLDSLGGGISTYMRSQMEKVRDHAEDLCRADKTLI